jgi:hypothetical protein
LAERKQALKLWGTHVERIVGRVLEHHIVIPRVA